MMYGLEWLSYFSRKKKFQWTEEELKYVRDWNAAVNAGEKIGSQLRIRLPNDYQVKDKENIKIKAHVKFDDWEGDWDDYQALKAKQKITNEEHKKMPTVVMGKTTDEWSKLITAPEFYRIFAEQDWAALLKWANREKLMTREEALNKMYPMAYGTTKREELLDCLVALELIKFEEEKKETEMIVSLDQSDGNIRWAEQAARRKIVAEYGDIRLMKWPEGLVLWVGGRIVWESWKSTTEAYYDQANKS